MSKIQSESVRCMFLRSTPALMMSATLLSIGSTGCIDNPATATDETAAQTDLTVSDLPRSDLIIPGPPSQSLGDALADLLEAPDAHLVAPAAQPAATTASVVVACSNPGWIRPFGTNLFVSTRVDYTGGDYATVSVLIGTGAGTFMARTTM